MMKKMNMVYAVTAAILAVTMTGCGFTQETADKSANQSAVSSEDVSRDEVSGQTETKNTESENAEIVALSQKEETAEQDSELFTK